jgi:hypothetical protein
LKEKRVHPARRATPALKVPLDHQVLPELLGLPVLLGHKDQKAIPARQTPNKKYRFDRGRLSPAALSLALAPFHRAEIGGPL